MTGVRTPWYTDDMSKDEVAEAKRRWAEERTPEARDRYHALIRESSAKLERDLAERATLREATRAPIEERHDAAEAVGVELSAAALRVLDEWAWANDEDPEIAVAVRRVLRGAPIDRLGATRLAGLLETAAAAQEQDADLTTSRAARTMRAAARRIQDA